MNLYIITTFAEPANRASDLISLAMISEDNKPYYQACVLRADRIRAFVSRDIIPVLNVDRKINYQELVETFATYIRSLGATHIDLHSPSTKHIQTFRRLMLAANITDIAFTPHLSLVDYQKHSELRYNAYSDVCAYKDVMTGVHAATSVVGTVETEYLFDRYKMKYEEEYSCWVLRRLNGDYVDRDTYQHDLMQKYRLPIPT